MNPIEKKFNTIAKFLNAAVFLIGLSALAGWIFNIEILKSVFLEAVSMKANTAIVFILSGTALFFYLQTNNPENSLSRIIVRSCALIIFLFGITTFFEYISGINFGLDQLFFREPEGAIFTSSPGRMAFNTAINFIMVGLALFFLGFKRTRSIWLIQIMAILISFSGFLSLTGYLYHANPIFIGLHYSTAMAIHAAIAFILFGAALLFSTSGGIMSIIAGQNAGSQMFRRILPVAILIPLILGWAKLELIVEGLISDELGTALIILLNIYLIIVYLAILSLFMNKEDEKRKQVEISLSESELRYRLLIDNSMDAILLTAPDGKILSANPAACRMFGRTEEEICRIGRAGIIDTTDPRLPTMLKERIRTGKIKGELTFLRKDGTKFPGELSSTIFKDKDGHDKTSMIVRDITERKQAEEALVTSEKKLTEAQRLGRIGNWDWDMATDTITWSKEYYRIFGLDSKQKPPGYEEHLKVYTPESAAKLDEAVKKNTQTGEAYELDLEIANPKGPTRWITARSETKRDDQGKIIGLRGTAQDITERKLAEEALKKSEKMFSALAQSSPDCIKQFDLDGNLVFINNGGLEEHGFKNVEEAKKRGVTGTIIPKDRIRSKEAFFQATKGKSSSIEIQHTPEGANREYCMEIFTPIRDEKNKITGVLGISRDITKRIQIEEELKRTVEKLKELDKLKDNFLNVTTHELKAPLVPISSQTQLLLSGNYGKLNQKQQEALEMILRNEKSLNRLTGDVLDIAKIKSNKLKLILQKTSLDKVIMETVKGLEKTAEENRITLSLLPMPELPQITIDEKRIMQVLSNLLDNALKFTPEKGKIKVKVQKKKNDIIVTVEDTGIGLSRENIEKIFTPFFQVESDLTRKYRGTGLGLAISKGIIETHRGRIWAESEGEGRGSAFSFSLPIKTK